MSLSKVINLGSAQYKVMMFLKNRPAEWLSNRQISDLMEPNKKKAFRFSGNDPVLGHSLYALHHMGLVEKRDREIEKTGAWSDGIARKAWVTEWRIIDRSIIYKTTYLEWETDRPETWHVVQEIDGKIIDLGQNW